MNSESQPRLLDAEQAQPAGPRPGVEDPQAVRVLSVPEPLATMILLGIKKIYVTGRWTTHRGFTLIYSPGLGRLPVENLPSEALKQIEGREMHRKSVIGHVRITLAAPTEGLNPAFVHHGLTPMERDLDNFDRKGSYALYLAEPAWLARPVPTTGRGQLWKPDQRTLAQVMGQLR